MSGAIQYLIVPLAILLVAGATTQADSSSIWDVKGPDDGRIHIFRTYYEMKWVVTEKPEPGQEVEGVRQHLKNFVENYPELLRENLTLFTVFAYDEQRLHELDEVIYRLQNMTKEEVKEKLRDVWREPIPYGYPHSGSHLAGIYELSEVQANGDIVRVQPETGKMTLNDRCYKILEKGKGEKNNLPWVKVQEYKLKEDHLDDQPNSHVVIFKFLELKEPPLIRVTSAGGDYHFHSTTALEVGRELEPDGEPFILITGRQ